MVNKILLSVAVVLAGSSAFAHGHHDHDESLGQVVSVPVGAVADEDTLRALYTEGHGVTEGGDDSDSRIKAWLNNVNVKKWLLNNLRWYQMHSDDPKLRDHVANLAMLLSLSHGTETIGGLTVSAYAATSFAHSHSLLSAGMSLLGLGFTFGGGEVLCIGVFFAYKKWPMQIDRIVTVPRVVIFSMGRYLVEEFGLKAAFHWMFERVAADQVLLNRLMTDPGSYQAEIEDDEIEVQLRPLSSVQRVLLGDSGGTLHFRRVGDSLRLAMIELDHDLLRTLSRADFKALVAPFGWNIRSLLLEIYDHERGTGGPFSSLLDYLFGKGPAGRPFKNSFVTDVANVKVSSDQTQLRIMLQPNAFRINSPYRIRNFWSEMASVAAIPCSQMHQ